MMPLSCQHCLWIMKVKKTRRLYPNFSTYSLIR